MEHRNKNVTQYRYGDTFFHVKSQKTDTLLKNIAIQLQIPILITLYKGCMKKYLYR